MIVFGIVLAAAGLVIVFLFDVAAILLIAVGIVVAVVGGTAAVYGGVLEKVWGLPVLALGIVLAVMGVFMDFLLDLWIVQSVIRYGGMVMVVVGVIMTLIGLIGMFKGDDDSRIEKLINRELDSVLLRALHVLLKQGFSRCGNQVMAILPHFLG